MKFETSIKMKLSAVLVLLLVAPTVSHAVEQNYMTVQLLEDGSAHITLESKNPKNLEELKSIIKDPSIKSIYWSKLSSIFREIENLDIHASSDSIIIEFDCEVAEQKEKGWAINKIDFKNELNPVSTLEIKLPSGKRLKIADPKPAEISGNILVWHDISYIPNITYSSTSFLKPFISILIVIIAITGILFILKRRSFGS